MSDHFDKHVKALKKRGISTSKSYKSKAHEKAIKKAMGESEKFHKTKLNATTSYGKNLFGSAINHTLNKNK